jgi:hypothetical protein
VWIPAGKRAPYAFESEAVRPTLEVEAHEVRGKRLVCWVHLRTVTTSVVHSCSGTEFRVSGKVHDGCSMVTAPVIHTVSCHAALRPNSVIFTAFRPNSVTYTALRP